MRTPNADGLVALFPPGVAVTDVDLMEKYRRDYTSEPPAGHPLAVVRAESAVHVQDCLRWASVNGVAVVPRGTGTGLAGGATALEGGIVLTLERMTRIDIDDVCAIATVEPGALNVDVKTAAAEHGLWYPPDPASFRISSIGGNIATNAGGLCCVKYGVTVDYVLGLEVVLADGTLVTLGGRTLKDVAGLPLVKLFVGSEGILGVVTKAHLRLVPLPPVASTMIATFPTLRAAGEAVVAIRRAMRPSMLELLNSVILNAVEDYQPMGLDRDAAALLLGQSDSPGDSRSHEVERMAHLCREAGATEAYATDDELEAGQLIEVRRAAGTALQVRGALLTEDIAVPIDQLPALLDAIAAIAVEHRVEIPIAAHAGDGNAHPAIIYNSEDPEHVKRAYQAFDALLRAAIACGGTITGEHGVGRSKRHVLPEQLGSDVLELNRRIKAALDPAGTLNPGVMFR